MVNLLSSPAGKWWLIGGAGASAAVIWEYRKARASKAKAALATTTVGNATDALADGSQTTSSGIDPATGLPYDSTDLYSGTSTGTAVGSPYGALSNLTFNPATGQYSAPVGTGTPTTNAQWVVQAANYLQSEGFNSQAVSAALGAYINGSGITQDQLTIIQAAMAAFGTPPVAVPAPSVAASTGQTLDTGDKLSGALSGGVFYSSPGNGVAGDLSKGPGIYVISGGTRYHVTSTTWANLHPQPPATSTDVSSSIWSLPYGGVI